MLILCLSSSLMNVWFLSEQEANSCSSQQLTLKLSKERCRECAIWAMSLFNLVMSCIPSTKSLWKRFFPMRLESEEPSHGAFLPLSDSLGCLMDMYSLVLASSKVVLSTKLMPVHLPQRAFLVDKPCFGGVRAAALKSFAITNCLIFNQNRAGKCLQASAKRC